MFRPLSPELLAGGHAEARSDGRRDLSYLRCVRTARLQVALELTAVVRDPHLRVKLPMVSPVFTAQA